MKSWECILLYLLGWSYFGIIFVRVENIVNSLYLKRIGESFNVDKIYLWVECKCVGRRKVLGVLGWGRVLIIFILVLGNLIYVLVLIRKMRFFCILLFCYIVIFNNRNIFNVIKCNVKIGKDGKVCVICR